MLWIPHAFVMKCITMCVCVCVCMNEENVMSHNKDHILTVERPERNEGERSLCCCKSKASVLTSSNWKLIIAHCRQKHPVPGRTEDSIIEIWILKNPKSVKSKGCEHVGWGRKRESRITVQEFTSGQWPKAWQSLRRSQGEEAGS